MTMYGAAAALVLALALPGASPAEDAGPAATNAIAGAWAGRLTHDGETQPLALEFEPAADGQLLLKVTLPIVHLARTPLMKGKPVVEGGQVRLDPFVFDLDEAGGTLSGTMPEGLAPAYKIRFTLRRVPAVEVAQRPQPTAPLAEPVWTFDAGAALWAGPTFADGVLYFGGEDGQLHALDARTGKPRWSFRAGGRVRVRPTVAAGAVYFQADDGFLYRLGAAGGQERWRVRLVAKPIERLPFDDPKSRYDRFGSDVTVDGDRLYVGTHDGRVVALDAARGATVWEFATGESVLAAPAVAHGRVYVGSYDKHVYALDAAGGRLAWKRDVRGAVVSTPAPAGDRLVVGTRAYDLFGLDAATGDVAWKRYVWFSWVESSATVRDGVAYVGSSDAAAVYAFDARTGAPAWKTDVFGWAWGQPAVSGERVYAGTSSQPGYLGDAHSGGAMALDRRTGEPAWRFVASPPAAPAGKPEGAGKPTYGFPGSPAVGDGLVFFTGLDGKAYAFRP